MASFNIQNFREGQEMTVGAINGISTDARWLVETDIFRDGILTWISKEQAVKILDYGCGVGRLAKALLSANDNIEILGVDQSPGMLEHAKSYVNSDRFKTMLDSDFLSSSEQFDFGYCIYCLQHIKAELVRPVIERLSKSTDTLLVVNSNTRMALPNFIDDGINIINELRPYYKTSFNFLPSQIIVREQVIRQMFLEGTWRHWAFVFKKEFEKQ